jgi:hypothetical protein
MTILILAHVAGNGGIRNGKYKKDGFHGNVKASGLPVKQCKGNVLRWFAKIFVLLRSEMCPADQTGGAIQRI